MGKVRDFVRSSKAARAIVNAIGVGSAFGLAATLTLWAVSTTVYLNIMWGFGSGKFLQCSMLSGYCAILGFELSGEEQTGATVATLPLDAAGIGEFAGAIARRPFRFESFGSFDMPLEITFPLWAPLAVFTALVFIAIWLSFRFNVRTLSILAAFYCVFAGLLTFVVKNY